MEQLTNTLLPQPRTCFHTDIQSVGKLSDFLGHYEVFLDLFSYSLFDVWWELNSYFPVPWGLHLLFFISVLAPKIPGLVGVFTGHLSVSPNKQYLLVIPVLIYFSFHFKYSPLFLFLSFPPIPPSSPLSTSLSLPTPRLSSILSQLLLIYLILFPLIRVFGRIRAESRSTPGHSSCYLGNLLEIFSDYIVKDTLFAWTDTRICCLLLNSLIDFHHLNWIKNWWNFPPPKHRLKYLSILSTSSSSHPLFLSLFFPSPS